MFDYLLYWFAAAGMVCLAFLAFIGGQLVIGAMRFAASFALANMRSSMLKGVSQEVRDALTPPDKDDEDEPKASEKPETAEKK